MIGETTGERTGALFAREAKKIAPAPLYGPRALRPGGTGTFSSSSLSNVKELMEQAGYKNITKTLAPRTMISGRLSMPAIQYTGKTRRLTWKYQ